MSKTATATLLKVHKSTIYRELKRNSNKRRDNAKKAEALSQDRRKEAFKHKKFTSWMQERVKKKLRLDWSQEQISGYYKVNGLPMVSTEHIYQFIYQDKAKGVQLYQHLRTRVKKSKKRSAIKDRRGQIPNRVGIEQRPAIVDNKERFGDWEGDTIIGKDRQEAIITLVERKSKFIVMAKPDGKKADSVRKEIINALAPFKELVKTITVDNGKEFTEHEKIASKLKA